ncbi:MAG: glycosyltransferase family 39 protein [Proteobacteria bacterium]|nr:glycosyltransferase family 39 protein [Pseudomonadota bacterium]MBU2518841.1 glycosyltransferase family 39 protein [Pseudomonadota bacterium]
MNNWLQNPLWQRRLYVLVLLAVCALLFFSLGGMRDLWESDETRYAELGREMLDSGSFSHWVIPRLNYVIYLEKPPLYYWLTALSFALFGVCEAAARLVPAVFGTLSVLIAFALGREMWGDEKAGFWSGLVLATSLMFFALSRVILVDMVLCFGIMLAVWGAWSLRAGRDWGLYAFWAGCAIGFLTKGVLGPGLAAMAVVLFAALAGEWRLLGRLLDWRGPALFALLCAPWVVAAALLHKGFLTYFFWDEQVGRLLTTKHQRFQPWWFYFALIPGAFFPWIALLPWALGRTFPWGAWRAPEARPWLLAAVWFVAFFLFLTLSRSKMLHYALPMLPPLALLVGRPLSGVMSWPRGAAAPAGLKASISALAALCLVAGLALLVVPATNPDIGYAHGGALLFAGPVFLALLALGVYWVRNRAWAAACAPLAVFLLLVLGAAAATPTLDRYRSLGPLLKPLAAQLKPGDLVATLGDYWHGAAFYTRRRVAVADNWGELDFGRRLAPDRDQWFLKGNQGLLKLMGGQRRVFAIAETPRYKRFHALAQKRPQALPLFAWATVGDKTLFSNRPPG